MKKTGHSKKGLIFLKQRVKSVGIIGMGSAIPEGILTNADLEKMVNTSDEWIRTRTGIRERRISSPDISTSVLAAEAARKALADGGVEPMELDLIIVATISPDMVFPSTACLVQAKLGAKKAAAYDLSAGCSGFIYGLVQGAQTVAAGLYKKVLVIGADILSKYVDWEDRSTCVLFGDAAGAAVLGEVEEGYGFRGFSLGADGEGAELLRLPAGGSAKPASVATVVNREHFIKMAGSEVFKFAVRIMGEASLEVLEKAGMVKEDIDLFVPHQANTRIIDAAAKKLNLSPEKVFINVDRFGNTSGASIPLALDEAYRNRRIKKGDNLLMVGFGAGLTWGSAIVRWSKEVLPES